MTAQYTDAAYNAPSDRHATPGSAWHAGAISPCVSALSRFHDVAICWKACAVLQFIALHSVAAAADCVERGAVHAMASRLVQPDDDHTKSFEMKWRALLGLQALCAGTQRKFMSHGDIEID